MIRAVTGRGNSRNGTSAKRVMTGTGAVDLVIPRDREGSFDPKIVPKHARRLDGFNERIIGAPRLSGVRGGWGVRVWSGVSIIVRVVLQLECGGDPRGP